MSSDLPAVRVENLGKRYDIGATPAGAPSLRDELVDGLSRLTRRGRAASTESFWALRGVTFEIPEGQRVGFIGRNGAGKSTLLKLLTRVTSPTEGHGEIRGRLGSLLEVGTGFNPELTGRDNIYLSGAILGMRKAEIEARVEDIVEFSGVSKFLGTPVKRYSSGMYLRLAFAVAAHLEPDVLIVDEVLAVGDAEFQKKCLGRMDELGRSGRTILFVSHSVAAVSRLCDRAILLERGTVVADGPPSQVLARYSTIGLGHGGVAIWPNGEGPGDAIARFVRVRILSDAVARDVIDIRRPVDIEVEYQVGDNVGAIRTHVQLEIQNDEGVVLFVTNDFVNAEWRDQQRTAGLVRETCTIPGNLLAEGRFTVGARLISFEPTIVHADAGTPVGFTVEDHSDGDGARGTWKGHFNGVVRPKLQWRIELAGGSGPFQQPPASPASALPLAVDAGALGSRQAGQMIAGGAQQPGTSKASVE